MAPRWEGRGLLEFLTGTGLENPWVLGSAAVTILALVVPVLIVLVIPIVIWLMWRILRRWRKRNGRSHQEPAASARY